MAQITFKFDVVFALHFLMGILILSISYFLVSLLEDVVIFCKNNICLFLRMYFADDNLS